MTGIRTAFIVALTVAASSSAYAQRGRQARFAPARQRMTPRQTQRVQPVRPLQAAIQRSQARSQARWDAANQKIAARTGQPVDQVSQTRQKRLQTLAVVLGGLGSGLSAYADTMNYSQPSVIPYRTPRGTGPSYFQSNWNAYNRSYSTNPIYAPVQIGTPWLRTLTP